MLEYEKFQEQQTKMMKMQEDYERQLTEMDDSKQHSLQELTEYYETKLQEMTARLEQVCTVHRLTFIVMGCYWNICHHSCSLTHLPVHRIF